MMRLSLQPIRSSHTAQQPYQGPGALRNRPTPDPSRRIRRYAWPWVSAPPTVEVCRSGRSGAARGTVPGPGCRGSDVVVLVPQLVSQTARRGDRLDSEVVFEAA